MGISLLIYLFILLFLLLSSGLISGSEVAFFSISKKQIHSENSKKNLLLKRLINDPEKLLATILITNNFINILIILVFAIFGNLFFEGLPQEFIFFVEVILVTFLILFFGEVLPKVYALRNPFVFAKKMVYPIYILQKICAPFIFILMNCKNLISKKLNSKKNSFSISTLSKAFKITSKNETTLQEKKILKGIMSFGNLEASEVMTPRVDMIAISREENFQEILEKIRTHNYSRIPVYEENLDKIKGILYIKDLIPHIHKTNFSWQNLMKSPIFTVPENRKLDDLFLDFQKRKQHLAIIVDEHGGTKGLITLDDIFVKIVGDISGTVEENESNYSVLDSKNYLFEGKTTLKNFCEILELKMDVFEKHKGGAETLAGFVLEILGRFPKEKEKVFFENYIFTVHLLKDKRIQQLKITLL